MDILQRFGVHFDCWGWWMSECECYRRRIKTEEKRQWSSLLFGGQNLCNSLPRHSCFAYIGRFWRIGWIHPFHLNHPGAWFIQLFKIVLGKPAVLLCCRSSVYPAWLPSSWPCCRQVQGGVDCWGPSVMPSLRSSRGRRLRTDFRSEKERVNAYLWYFTLSFHDSNPSRLPIHVLNYFQTCQLRGNIRNCQNSRYHWHH